MSNAHRHLFRGMFLGLLLTAATTHATDRPDGANDASRTWPRPPALLDDSLPGWDANNRERLNQLLIEHRPRHGGARRPVAVFDWDNTVVKNDIGDATLFWMIKNDKILQPPDADFRHTSQHLTTDAVAALNAACGPLALPGKPLPTSTATACANELVAVYDAATTHSGLAAWNSRITYYNNTAYQWVAQLQAGYKPHDINAFARAAYAENSANAPGTTQTIGTRTGYNHFVLIYDQMADLIDKMQRNGFDVWVLTASPQDFVEPIAARLGIAADHVVGIRQVEVRGRLSYDTQGCGPVRARENTLITFDEGKRCWINKAIYKEPPFAQLLVNPNPAKRPIFVAGDSDTDIAMLKDATVLKLTINRARIQTVCNALDNYGNKWLFQRMFILPRAQRTTPYPCSTSVDAIGATIVNEVGAPMADLPEPY
jgi:phosphoglycolate phosphatase-like HAD superfamily hydrolase